MVGNESWKAPRGVWKILFKSLEKLLINLKSQNSLSVLKYLGKEGEEWGCEQLE